MSVDQQDDQTAVEADEEQAGPREPFATIEEAIDDIREGRMVIVCDDEDRENEGDLTMAAQFVTAEKHQLHGQGRPRPHLPHAHPAALRASSTCRR